MGLKELCFQLLALQTSPLLLVIARRIVPAVVSSLFCTRNTFGDKDVEKVYFAL